MAKKDLMFLLVRFAAVFVLVWAIVWFTVCRDLTFTDGQPGAIENFPLNIKILAATFLAFIYTALLNLLVWCVLKFKKYRKNKKTAAPAA